MGRLARPSVASLLVRTRSGGEDLGTATAFVVEADGGGWLITARHVVRGRHQTTDAPLHPTGAVPDSIAVAQNAGTGIGQWRWTTEPLYDEASRPRWLEHPAWAGAVDAVAIPLTDVDGVRFYGYDPARPGTPLAYGVTTPLHVVGFPFIPSRDTFFALWSQAIVASEPEADFNGLPCFLVDCQTTAGHAGAPAIAYATSGTATLDDGSTMTVTKPRGRFVGLYSGRISPDSGLGVVWKASAIHEVVTGARWAEG